jgi:hypothetical protein
VQVAVNKDAPANNVASLHWLDTGLTLDNADVVSISASGTVDIYPSTPGQYHVGPDGYREPGVGSHYPAGSLIGKIGDQGAVFQIGASRRVRVTGDGGRLFLAIAPSAWNVTSSGGYTARLKVGVVP